MPFKNNNIAFGLTSNNNYQVGVSNVDNNDIIERGVKIPTINREEASWVYFDCSVGVMLDSGIVVHNRLPQVDRGYDTLAPNEYGNQQFNAVSTGVNLTCNDQYKDIVQRMGHARYWFRIWGRAMRIKYQIPIPGIKMIGGVPAIPYDKNPQWAYNSIVPGGNYGGVILWRAEWSLWYTTAVPPISQVIPASDPSSLIRTTDAGPPLPKSIQAPYSSSDDNAVTSSPITGVATSAASVAGVVR